MQGTLLLAKQLQPDLEKLVVIGGTSDCDQRTIARIQTAMGVLPAGVTVEYWTNLPFAEVEARVKTLREGSAILISTIFEDGTGQTIYMTHACQRISPSASVPVYSLTPGAIGSGAMGGAVVNPRALGEKAARLGLEMLDAGPRGKPAVEDTAASILMVDWKALQRWNINPARLPAGCTISNIAAATVILAQALTIAALIAQRLRRRRAEAEILRQRHELAHVTRVSTMGQLASSLAHEINQPLGAILRNTEAAELFLQREKPDLAELKSILADIRKDDQRAGGVIDRMRSLLKRRALESNPVNVRELLDETLALALPDAQARQMKLTVEAPAELPEIRGDRVHLQQVLLNLILNGMDALKGRANGEGVVSIHASAGTNGSVEISVSDCGTGIAADKIGRVFEPFFTTKPDGLGMGLAISRTIVEAHGGNIRAQNNSTYGATFKITLPAHLA